jgi:hypothetical protein
MHLRLGMRCARCRWHWRGFFLVLTFFVWAIPARAFFPALPTSAVAARNGNTPSNNGGTTPPGDHTTPPGPNQPPTGNLPPPPPPPPDGPPTDNGPPDTPPDTPPEAVPEMDPNALIGACGLLITGMLLFTDRRRRA